jgi:periplasmic copper chaperone A
MKKFTSLNILFLMISSMLVCISSSAFAGGNVKIEGPWIREAPPHAAVLAGYLTIDNPSAKMVKLVHATSPAFGKIEMHRSVMKNGMMHMIKQASIRVPAKGKVKLAPDGYHLMLMKPKRELKAGDKVSMTLKFSNGVKTTINVPVKKAMGGSMKMDMSHDQNTHGGDI